MTKTLSPRTVDQLETAIGDVAKLATRGLDEGSRPAQSAADAVAAHGNAIIDRATQEALDSMRALRRQIDDNEKMLLDNAARIRAEVESHIRMTALAQSAASVLAGQLQDARAEHAELVNAVTISKAA